MKALSLWQPYASLILAGVKGFETRGWATAIRGRVAIHAAKSNEGFRSLSPVAWELTKYYLGVSLPTELRRGVVLGSVDLTDCHATDSAAFMERIPPREAHLGDFSPGRFAFELSEPEPLAEPFAFRGGQRWFEVPLTPPPSLQADLFD